MVVFERPLPSFELILPPKLKKIVPDSSTSTHKESYVPTGIFVLRKQSLTVSFFSGGQSHGGHNKRANDGDIQVRTRLHPKGKGGGKGGQKGNSSSKGQSSHKGQKGGMKGNAKGRNSGKWPNTVLSPQSRSLYVSLLRQLQRGCDD